MEIDLLDLQVSCSSGDSDGARGFRVEDTVELVGGSDRLEAVQGVQVSSTATVVSQSTVPSFFGHATGWFDFHFSSFKGRPEPFYASTSVTAHSSRLGRGGRGHRSDVKTSFRHEDS